MQHFWDADKVLGKWYAQNVTRRGPDVEWDAYFLYGPSAHWHGDPPEVVSWGRTIMGFRERLSQDLAALLEAGHTATE